MLSVGLGPAALTHRLARVTMKTLLDVGVLEIKYCLLC